MEGGASHQSAGSASSRAIPSAGAAALTALAGAAARHRVALIELFVVGAYVALRTADAPMPLMFAWTGLAALTALVAPSSGLVVLAAVGPWDDPFRGVSPFRSTPFLVVSLGAAVFVRQLRHPPRSLRNLPLLLCGAVMIVTGLGVLHSYVRFGPEWELAARQWVNRIGGALTILLVAYWVARRGSLRPFLVVLVSAVAAAIVSLVGFLRPNLFEGGPFDWLLAPESGTERLAGVVASWNALAVLVAVPAAMVLAVAIFARPRAWRVAAAVTAVPLLVALYLTYSRAPILALFAVAVIYAWRLRARLGVALLAVGLVLGLVLLPLYMSTRGEVLGGGARPSRGNPLIETDQQRLRAWSAAGRIFLASPLVGQGYRSFNVLREEYGEPLLSDAHNEWLVFFAEEGLVGGTLAVAFVVVTMRTLARGRG